MEEGPQTEAPEASTEAPTPMEVENEGAVAGDEVQNPPNQEGQEVRNLSLQKILSYDFGEKIFKSVTFVIKLLSGFK